MQISRWKLVVLSAFALAGLIFYGSTCSEKSTSPTSKPSPTTAPERRLAEFAKAKARMRSDSAKSGTSSTPYRPIQRNVAGGDNLSDVSKGARWEPSDAESEASANERLKQMLAFPSDDEASDLIQSAAMDGTRDLIPLVEAALGQTSAAIRAAALEALGSFSDAASIVPLVERGLTDIDNDVRLAALTGALGLPSDALLPLLESAITNSSNDVRENALDVAEALNEGDFRGLLFRAANGSHPDLAQRAISDLERVINKRSVPEAFSLINSPQSEIKEAIAILLETRLGKAFSNATEASQWWTQNANRFDDDLVEIEAAP